MRIVTIQGLHIDPKIQITFSIEEAKLLSNVVGQHFVDHPDYHNADFAEDLFEGLSDIGIRE